MRSDYQHSIELTWRMHYPLGPLASVGLTLHEVIVTIKRMRVGVTPCWNKIIINSFRKWMLTVLPWLMVVSNDSLMPCSYPIGVANGLSSLPTQVGQVKLCIPKE